MMKLVYKLQAEDYKFDFPVSYLPVSTPCEDSYAGGGEPYAAAAVVVGGPALRGAVTVGKRSHSVCSGPRRHHKLQLQWFL